MDHLWSRRDLDYNDDDWFKKGRVLQKRVHLCNALIWQRDGEIILTFLSCVSAPPPADPALEEGHESLHHNVPGAGGLSAHQRFLLHLPETQLQADRV